MQNIKRERCINWEKEEKQLFRDILRPYLSIIENKDLSTNTNKEKMKAWVEITEKFNVANVRPRDKKQLINQWKCLKLNSKKELSSYRREITKTGGGPKPPSPSPDTMEVAEMIPQEFEVDFNEFNCDGFENSKSEAISERIDILEEPEPTIINIRNDENFPNDVKDDEPKSKHILTTPLKSKKTPKAKTQESFNFSEASYNDMHNFRVLENERQQKEHELRMKNLDLQQKEHELCVKNLDLQSQNEQQQKEHELRMKNLDLQSQILTKMLEGYINKI